MELAQPAQPMTAEEIEARNKETIELIARTCHGANSTYREATGEPAQPSWESFENKESAIDGVMFVLGNLLTTAEDCHENWYQTMAEAGWGYGPQMVPSLKKHPCMTAFNELPYEQQMQDSIFIGVAREMLKKAIASGRLIVDRPLTPGEEAIDVSFNVGGNPRVARIKQGFADLHDLVVKEANAHQLVILNKAHAVVRKNLAAEHPDWDADQVNKALGSFQASPALGKMHRLVSMALTDIENGAMHAVKAITR